MTVQADVQEEMREHHTHCVPHLVSLRMLVHGDLVGDAGAPLPPGVVDEVGQATRVILAETRAAERAVLAGFAGSRGFSRVARFLAARLTRLATAADDVMTAAQSGNARALRQHLRRFDTLTSAMWTVQLSIYTSATPAP